MMKVTNDASFEALASASLYLMSGADWNQYYPAMAQWLRGPDEVTRSSAVERLCMAVFGAEQSSFVQARNAGVTLPFQPEQRLAWFLSQLEMAHSSFDDIIPTFLKDLRYHGDREPYRTPMLAWLKRLQDERPKNVRQDVVAGTIILISLFDDGDADDLAQLIGLLDDPSDYVRACAAHQLSGIDSGHLSAANAFALIKEKELLRPGIAGPFWSEWSFMRENVPVDAIDWMMDILENRSGPEPADMPFNGIDFYLHEICDFSPDTVRRMIKGGFVELAIETATETRGFVPGMEAVLLELADNVERHVCLRAQRQLAQYYRVLHPGAAHNSIRFLPEWSAACDMFCFFWDSDKPFLSSIVVYPKYHGAHFDDDLAWSLVDRLLPPDIRGELVNSPPGFGGDGPAEPWVMENQVVRSYAAGPSVRLDGDVGTKLWDRIEIYGGRLGRLWSPLGGAALQLSSP